MSLIDEWRSAWKYLSVQASSIGLAISAAYGLMYNQLKENITPQYMAILTGAVFVLAILGRLVSQTPKDETQ